MDGPGRTGACPRSLSTAVVELELETVSPPDFQAKNLLWISRSTISVIQPSTDTFDTCCVLGFYDKTDMEGGRWRGNT